MKIHLNKKLRRFRLKNRRRLLKAIRQAAELSGVDACLQPDDSLAVVLVGRQVMADLNERYLGHKGATDVISFDYLDAGPTCGRADAGAHIAAEIIVCMDVAAEQAPRYTHRLEQEVMMYIIHGFLHLIGDSDKAPAERTAMNRRARRILKRLEKTIPVNDIFHNEYRSST